MHNYDKRPNVILTIEKIEFAALVDTGASRSIISESIFNLLGNSHKIDETEKEELNDASGNKMEVGEKIKLQVVFQGDILEQEFIVMKKSI